MGIDGDQTFHNGQPSSEIKPTKADWIRNVIKNWHNMEFDHK